MKNTTLDSREPPGSPYMPLSCLCASKVFLQNDLGIPVIVGLWAGDGVHPDYWHPLHQGRDAGKGQTELLRMARSSPILTSEDQDYFFYISLKWQHASLGWLHSTIAVRIATEHFVDSDTVYSTMYFDVGTTSSPRTPNRWLTKSAGTGAITITEPGFKVECRRYSTFSYDDLCITLSTASPSSNVSKAVLSTEPFVASMRELRSYNAAKRFKFGDMVRFNRERRFPHRQSKSESVLPLQARL